MIAVGFEWWLARRHYAGSALPRSRIDEIVDATLRWRNPKSLLFDRWRGIRSVPGYDGEFKGNSKDRITLTRVPKFF